MLVSMSHNLSHIFSQWKVIEKTAEFWLDKNTEIKSVFVRNSQKCFSGIYGAEFHVLCTFSGESNFTQSPWGV